MIEGVSFRISAEAITRRAQDLMLSGEWVKAQRYLTDTLDGLSTDQAHRVMRGETVFVSVDGEGRPDPRGDGVQFAEVAGMPLPDDLPDFARDVRAIWAGALLVRGTHYQPYAYVTTVGPVRSWDPDATLPRAMRDAARRNVGPGEWDEVARVRMEDDVRPALYVDDPDEDLVLDVALPPELPANGPHAERVRYLPVPFLFKRLREPPPWVRPAATRAESVAACLRAGVIPSETGYLVAHGTMPPRADPLVAAQPRDDGPRMPTEEELAEGEARRSREGEAHMAAIARDLESAKAKVAEQLAVPGRDGWLDLRVGGEVVRVPEAPFVSWALLRCRAPTLAPPWRPCSRPGLKLGMEHDQDDPYHTDWMIGAGYDVRTFDWYGEQGKALREAALDLMGEVQSRHLGQGCTVLADGGPRTGRAYVARRGRTDAPALGDVVVLPDAGAHWLDTVVAACQGNQGAVVVAQGGAVAHLVVVTGAAGATIVREADAMRRYADGQTLSVDPVARRVAILPEAVEVAAPDDEGTSPSP